MHSNLIGTAVCVCYCAQLIAINSCVTWYLQLISLDVFFFLFIDNEIEAEEVQ